MANAIDGVTNVIITNQRSTNLKIRPLYLIFGKIRKSIDSIRDSDSVILGNKIRFGIRIRSIEKKRFDSGFGFGKIEK